MKFEQVEPNYEFQSAMWETDDGKVVIVERSQGPQHEGKYNAVVTTQQGGGPNVSTEVLAQNVSESAADKAAREWLTQT